MVIDSWIRSEGQLYTDEDVRQSEFNLYLPHYRVFRQELVDYLCEQRVIRAKSVAALQEVTGRHVARLVDYMSLDPLNERYKSKPDFSDLSHIYGQIKAEVVRKYDIARQEEIMGMIDILFDLQYRIYGLDVENRFYKYASQTYYGWIGLLQHYDKDSFPRVSLSALASYMGYSHGLISEILSKLERGEIHRQYSNTIYSYIDKICEKCDLEGTLGTNLRRELELIAKSYLSLIKAVESEYDTIEVVIDGLRLRYPNNQKLDLIEDIVEILNIPNVDSSKISLLLFNDKDYLITQFLATYESNPKIIERPLIQTLNWMKACVLDSDSSIFSDYIQLSDVLWQMITEKIQFTIDCWLKSNPYDISYFTPSSSGFSIIYGQEVDEMTFDLLNYIWYAFALYTSNPKISFETIKDLVRAKTGFLTLVTKEDRGRLISAETLEATKTKLQEAVDQGTDSHKINVYQNTISAIGVYLDIINEKREVFRTTLRPSQKRLRNLFSSDQYIRSYLIMNILSRDLGFDPLFFEDLDESLFDKNQATGMYQLHHKDRARSWSIYIRDLVLVNLRYHKLYDSAHISTNDVNILQVGIKMLQELGADRYKEGQGNWEITERDIQNVFRALGGGSEYRFLDGRTVLEWWTDGSSVAGKTQSQKPFTRRLAAFNERIKYLVDHDYDYEAWLNNFYSSNAPDWITKGKIQMDKYQWMANTLKEVHYYVHLEDVDLVREIWSVWTP
ncbi:hypothetical protein ES705_04397 [subsurface metagenome]